MNCHCHQKSKQMLCQGETDEKAKHGEATVTPQYQAFSSGPLEIHQNAILGWIANSRTEDDPVF